MNPVTCKAIHFMAISAWVAVLLAGSQTNAQNSPAQATTPPPTDYQVIERGANHRVWQRTEYETLPDGSVVPHLHQYTELASGLHYLNASGQWVESQEQIEAYPQGAIARQGQFQAIFADNLNTSGAIDVQTADGNRLRSTILGLMYVDPTTGDAVTIARLQDSEGQLISANQVLYTNAFEGVLADVLYEYKISGLEQDIILKQQPPAPEVFGMNSQTVELVAFTEFIEPAPAWVVQSPATGDDEDAGEEIGWGAVHLGNGKAFLLNGQDAPVKVIKQYMELQGRYFLLEKVRLNTIQASLAELPEQASLTVPRPNLMVAKNWVLPKATGSRSKTGPMRLAQGQKPTGGYVLDYVTVSGGFTNYNFQGDTTYYVSGTLSLYGTNTFEGGTVIKYATNGAIQITPGPGTTPGVIWGGSAYRPVILTAKDDNSVGESFGSGTPSGYYGAPMMLLAGFSPQTSLIGSRFAFANTGIMLNGGSNAKFYSAQFVQCQNGISIVGGTAFIGNGLFANTKTNLVYASGGGIVNAQNVTFSGSSLLATAPGTQMGNYLALTNCNLVNVTNLVAGVLEATNGNYNGFFQSPYFSPLAPVGFINVNQPFQSAGGGGYYLATNSPWHNVGTTNLDPYLLSELATKTTYPPIVYSFLSGNYSNSANLFPQAIRDAYGSPDLGYHYDPLDYLVGGLFITNGTIIFNTGTAVGIYATTSMYQYGIGINGQAQFVSIGAPNNLNHVAFYNTVQEGSVTNWVKASEGLIMSWYGTNQQYQCQFTDWSVMAQDSWLIWKYFYITNGSPEAFQNCQFHGGQLETDYPTFCLTNCLFDRVYLGLYPSDANLSVFRNNLFYGGTFDFAPAMTNSIIADNSFNQTAIPDEMAGVGTWYFGGHNAYVTNFNLLVPTLAGDLIQSNLPVYQTSWYGNYYLPTNSTLIQAGSTTANLIGLYHFTTQTNQMPEGDAVVDIGYHYVGTDQYGNPLDTNGDGIPDYVEDSNGNGIFDTGDLGDWHISPYGLNAQNHLQVFTPLK